MDVLETKYLSTDLNFMYKVLQYGNNKVRLVGTGSMASQYYPADFDFLCLVSKKESINKVYNNFKKIVDKIKQANNLFFIEFKIQKNAKKGKEPEKHKVYNLNDINMKFFEAFFNDVELCKIDLIIYLSNGAFKEVSCIYFFSNKELNMNDYIKALLDDQVYYYNEGKYYKSLKRLMLSAKYKEPIDKNLMIVITSLFNSSVGKLYELDNEIQAAIIYRDKYDDKMARERIKNFIRSIGLYNLPASKLEEVSKEYQAVINKEALKLYKKYKLPVGHLPPYNSIRLH